MIYALAAQAVLAIHFGFIVFVLIGGFLALRWRRLPLLHLPALAWGVTVEFSGWTCPLTPLENLLRGLSGAAGYSGSFIEHYLLRLIYPEGLTREVQIALGVTVLVLNAIAYGLWWTRRRPGQKL
jgi:hypothetical protein